MKSKQITKQMRFSIMNKALDWKFAKEDAKLLKLENATALAVYNDVFSPIFRGRWRCCRIGWLVQRLAI